MPTETQLNTFCKPVARSARNPKRLGVAIVSFGNPELKSVLKLNKRRPHSLCGQSHVYLAEYDVALAALLVLDRVL